MDVRWVAAFCAAGSSESADVTKRAAARRSILRKAQNTRRIDARAGSDRSREEFRRSSSDGSREAAAGDKLGIHEVDGERFCRILRMLGHCCRDSGVSVPRAASGRLMEET